jgi:hypothetical protein
MHFHLPKPLHGWREFAGEVEIIVLGVLIASSASERPRRLQSKTCQPVAASAYRNRDKRWSARRRARVRDFSSVNAARRQTTLALCS